MKLGIDSVFLNSLEHPSLDIRINQGSFSWASSATIDPDSLPSLRDLNLNIVRGSFVLILGRVGSKIDLLSRAEARFVIVRRQDDLTQCFAR